MGSTKKEQPPGSSVDEERPPVSPLALDQERLDIVIGMVREYRIIDISAVLSRIGNNDLRDPLLRSVEAHPNLKAHAGPRTIFLQWRMTASRPAN